jgi:quercetin dioxygenase-like cupin family protein
MSPIPSPIHCAVVLLGAAACRASPAQDRSHDVRSSILLAQTLPQVEKSHPRVTLVEVTYEPGGASLPHSHGCPVVGYVLEGALRSQVEGEPEAIYRAGQSFYEPPNAVHRVSANASRKEPTRFLAYFVCDGETPATGVQ